jgi:hypothetical protein
MAVKHPVRLPRGSKARGESGALSHRAGSDAVQPGGLGSTRVPLGTSVTPMSETSPADLAIAFRSFTRRLTDALAPVKGDTTVAALQLRELQAVIARASAITGSPANVSAIANAIEARPGPAWPDADVEALRACALDGGKLLRLIERAAEEAAAQR